MFAKRLLRKTVPQGKSLKQSPGEGIITDEQKHISVADDGTFCAPKRTSDSLLLLCCEKALRVYSLESVLEGESKWIHKVDLEKPCCWSATFRKDENIGVVLLYQTGLLEIRSFRGLELIAGSSLLSILRWNLNANMAKTICSDDSGHIALNNSSELAFISILYGENDFRIPDSLACLHDKVLAAAADAAMNMHDPSPGIIGNIIKGFKGGSVRNTIDNNKSPLRANFAKELGNIFSKNPFCDSSKRVMYEQNDVELSIDDIEIDDIVPISSSSTASSTLGSTSKQNRTGEEIDREKLLGGRAGDEKPRMRKPEEIISQYRKAGDASGATKQARDKLNVEKNLRDWTGALLIWRVELRTSSQWLMNLSRHWKAGNGGRYECMFPQSQICVPCSATACSFYLLPRILEHTASWLNLQLQS